MSGKKNPRRQGPPRAHPHTPHGRNARDASTWDFYESLLFVSFTHDMCTPRCWVPRPKCRSDLVAAAYVIHTVCANERSCFEKSCLQDAIANHVGVVFIRCFNISRPFRQRSIAQTLISLVFFIAIHVWRRRRYHTCYCLRTAAIGHNFLTVSSQK